MPNVSREDFETIDLEKIFQQAVFLIADRR